MATTKESPQVTIDGDVDSNSNGSSDPNNAGHILRPYTGASSPATSR